MKYLILFLLIQLSQLHQPCEGFFWVTPPRNSPQRRHLSRSLGTAQLLPNNEVDETTVSLSQRQAAWAQHLGSLSNVEGIQKYLVLMGQQYMATQEEVQRQESNHNDQSSSHPNLCWSGPTKVPGCMANVEIDICVDLQSNRLVQIRGTADAHVARGILALWASTCCNTTVDEVMQLTADETVAEAYGPLLRAALSTGRRTNGLRSLVETTQGRIQRILMDESKEDGATQGDSATVSRQETTQDSAAPTVALLLSGGVDSSVALNLLLRQGYNVTAFYLKIWLEDELAHLGTCPWEDDFATCEGVVAQVQENMNVTVPLHAISLQKEYQQRVISYTIKEAAQGRTPNPDILCNSRIKFGCFYDAIDATHTFDYVATGHYAQLTTDETTGLRRLQRAPDPIKDQSYFLCALTQKQLQHVLFPIGHLEKHQVRQLADEFGLPNRHRPDSQGLCFLGKVKFEEFLRAHLGERPGPIVDATTGEWLGQHRGVWYHTVGQRKGIGHVLDPKATARGPWYVVAKDPASDIVYCSNEYDQEIFDSPRSQVTVENVHWISGFPPSIPEIAVSSDRDISLDAEYCSIRLDMKIRHGPKLVSGLVTWYTDNPSVAEVKLDRKDGGLAPGQFVVMYLDNECLGGGVISERHWAKFLSASKTTNDSFVSV